MVAAAVPVGVLVVWGGVVVPVVPVDVAVPVPVVVAPAPVVVVPVAPVPLVPMVPVVPVPVVVVAVVDVPVPVPAGDHTVELRYRSPLVTGSLWLSFAVLFALSGLIAFHLWRERRSPGRS